MKRIAMISAMTLFVLVSVGCNSPFNSQTENLISDIQAADKAVADINKLGDRYSQGTEARLRAEINALKAQIATSGRHAHICLPVCVQHPAKPAPAPIVVVVPQPTTPVQQPQITEACDPCQGREVVVVPTCTNWRDCNPPTS